MPTQVQWRGGDTTQNNNFTGAEREISVNEDTHSLRVHDGVTAGGYELARADLSNAVGIASIVASGSITADGGFNIGISSAGTLVTTGPIKELNFIGVGNTFSVNGTRVDISISGGGGGGPETDTLDTVTDRGNSTTNGISVGVVTASSFVRVGGASTQFLKADGSIDSTVYLSSYTETDTLDSVTGRGNVTTNGISVGIVSASDGNFSGILSATGGFNIGISSGGTPVTSGPITTLNFIGVGNTFAINGTTVDISIQGGGGSGPETDTLDSVTSRGNSTNNGISVGVVTATRFSGPADYAILSGIATYASSSGIATTSNTSAYANVSGVSTSVSGGIANVSQLNVSGVSTLGNVQVSSGIITSTSGIVTYYGDGSKLTNVSSSIGIQSGGLVVGSGITTLNFIGAGNTFSVDGSRVNVSISGVTNISYAATTRTLSSSSGIGTVLPLVTSTEAGLIPAPPEGEPTGKVFTDALEWAEPPGGGSSDAGDLTSGTLSNERLSAKVMAAVNTTLWRNFT